MQHEGDQILAQASEAIRPRCSVTLYGGSTCACLDDYDDVLTAIEQADGPMALVELTLIEGDGELARQAVVCHQISSVYEITDSRWASHQAALKKMQDQMPSLEERLMRLRS